MVRFEYVLSKTTRDKTVDFPEYGKTTVSLQVENGIPGIHLDGVRLSDRMMEKFLLQALLKIGTSAIQTAAHVEAARKLYREKLDAWKDGTVTLRERGDGENLSPVEIEYAIEFQVKLAATVSPERFKAIMGSAKIIRGKETIPETVWPIFCDWQGEPKPGEELTKQQKFVAEVMATVDARRAELEKLAGEFADL